MMRVLLLLAVPVLLVSCGLPPRVEPRVLSFYEQVPESSPKWPRALAPPDPHLVVEGPQAPKELGQYGECDVVLIDESELGTVLFHVGRLEGADPAIGATATFKHPGPDKTRVSLTVDNGSFAMMSLVYPAHTERIKGHVLYVGTMAMLSQPEQVFIEKLRESGWHVAAMVPFSVMSEFQKLGLDPELRHRPVEEAAPKVGALIDHHLASQTYAADSLVAYLEKHEPGFLDGRRVLIGGSMGSLVVPPIAVKLGEVDSMVLLAGGGNVSRIVHDSKLEIFDPSEKIILSENQDELVLGGRPSGAMQRMKHDVFRHTELDPLRMAASLRRTNTLMLTANNDRIIPNENADLLHHALGHPERWHYRFGHVALFVRLPYQAERIERWMLEQIPNRSDK